ncbi:MAG: methyltransferase domain-containing protein [Pseudomonadota bacterium]
MARLPSFRTRAAPHTLPELMDGEPDLATYRACLESLATVNAASFGYTPTVRFAERLAAAHTGPGMLRLMDVGSGYGDTLRAVARRLSRKGIAAELIGADLNAHAAKIARAASPKDAGKVRLTFVTRDARALPVNDAPPDAIVSSLFAHHLEDDEIVAFLRFMDKTARVGWFVNDLYRSRFAATGFGALATVLRRHPVVRHDGPVSFARAFRKADWERYLAKAEISGARIFIGAPFRLCVEKIHDAR